MTGENKSTTGNVRTRFAPSPTGFMHVGNLRTALYEYLIAKSSGGTFILRIEDTDRERIVDGAVDIIYRTLATAGLFHDEGPDIGGSFGPYIQSERTELYRKYAELLVSEGKAYRCFCSKERLESLKENDDSHEITGYDRHCRNLSDEEISGMLAAGTPGVIRQKMPLDGFTSFTDLVFGEITVPNKELEDQVLLKADGFPTYNFANIVDDHLMRITHVVRGSEYLSSTPKYNLLYEAFGWDVPKYVHLPLIQGKNEDGTVSKLSKRHGATGFEDLVADGYLPEAIINYIALLGWCPKDNTNEIFSLDELTSAFSIDGISKSPATFDYEKLEWFNAEYIRRMDDTTFLTYARSEYAKLSGITGDKYALLREILQPRISKFSQISEKVAYMNGLPEFDPMLFEHKKSKSTLESSREMLMLAEKELDALPSWDKDTITSCFASLSERLVVKNSLILWPLRIAITGMLVTPGGAVEALLLLGKEVSMQRIRDARQRLISIQ